MKNFLLIFQMVILSLFNIAIFGQGTWTLQNNPSASYGESMQFVSATEGWISLDNHQLLHTTNAGTTWSIVTPNSTLNLGGLDAPGNRVSFVNQSTGWVLKTIEDSNQNGMGAALLKTTDGGASWTTTTLSTTAGDAGIQVQFIDANNGWVLIFNMNNGTATFLKTTNGGATWVPTNGGGIFHYVDTNVGYSFSASPSGIPPFNIYKTTDGGENWTLQYTDNSSGGFEEIHFTDANNGWIVGDLGKILKTNNGGTTWTSVTNAGLNTNYQNTEVFFLNPNLGWISTRLRNSENNYVLKTTDGGASWVTQQLPFTTKPFSLHFWDENNGWVTSDWYNLNGTDYPGNIAKYSYASSGFSNATLAGPWFYYNTPLNPYNDNLGYIIFDGNGNITGFNGFVGGAPPANYGTYSVQPNGQITGTLVVGSESFPLGGNLTSATTGTMSGNGFNFTLSKVSNPGLLQDKISGTISVGTCGQRFVTLNIGANGNITSVSDGFSQAIGHVFADQGVFIGHFYTGESGSWREVTISGYYNGLSNRLIGEANIDNNTCNSGTTLVDMVRANNVQSDWVQKSSGTNNNLKSVHFIDSNTGYVVGGGQQGQTILKTTNAGNNWTTLNSGSPYQLNSVFSINTNTTYVAGGDGSPNQTILKTTNGGNSWFASTGIGSVQINSMFFVNSTTGYAVGGGNSTGQNIILKTTNAGLSWTLQNPNTNPIDLALYSVFFTDENTGYIVGESGMTGTILKTTDGGANWALQTSGTGNHLYSVFFVDANTGFIAGKNGTLLKTTNGGTNWASLNTGIFGNLNAVCFLDVNLGYAVGENGTIIKTVDGGSHWTPEASGVIYSLNSIFFKNNVGYIVGDNGIILKNSNINLSTLDPVPFKNNKQILVYPNPNNGHFFANINTSKTHVYIEIFDTAGHRVYSKESIVMNGKAEVNFNPRTKGLYFIKISDGIHIFNDKIIIK